MSSSTRVIGRNSEHPGSAGPGRSYLRLREHAMLRVMILLPWAGVLAGLLALQGRGLRPAPLDLGLLAAGYLLSAIGFEGGFHRLFAHRAFSAHPALRAVLVVLGSTIAMGPVFGWAAIHRQHHQYSDLDNDPHSPKGAGWIGRLAGLWHAHIGWMWNAEVEMREYRRVIDLIEDPVVYRLGRIPLYFVWVALGFAAPAAIGGLASGSWLGAARGFFWGGAVRLLLIQNAGFAINSIGHTLGRRSYNSGDDSRDNIWLVLPSLGAGWQNTHHAFPSSWSNRMSWWQFDPASAFIKALAMMGLASNLKYPSEREILAQRRGA